MAPGAKPRLYGIFDSVRISSVDGENRIFYAFYKVRSVQSGRVELKVVSPEKQEVAHWSDDWPGGELLVQSAWAFTLDKFKQDGIYRFELWDGAADRLAYTELELRRR